MKLKDLVFLVNTVKATPFQVGKRHFCIKIAVFRISIGSLFNIKKTYLSLAFQYLNDLCLTNFLRAMSRLRTSCHPLKIETGRHCKPPLPRQNRICSVCNVIEDEEHFFVSCKKYDICFKFIITFYFSQPDLLVLICYFFSVKTATT
jgi:hypothetical protein